METALLTSIIVLNIFLLAVIGFLGFLVFKLLTEKNRSQSGPANVSTGTMENHFHPEIKKRLEEAQFTLPFNDDVFCSFHPSEPAEVQCGMCSRYFCHKCVRPMKSIYFCKEHMALHMRYEWSEVITLKTSSEDPEAGVRLYNQKLEIFKARQIPSYIETHYKIDVEGDFIETYLVLFAQSEKVEEFKSLLEV